MLLEKTVGKIVGGLEKQDVGKAVGKTIWDRQLDGFSRYIACACRAHELLKITNLVM